MTTFTIQELNKIEVTKEEEEAMDTLCRLGAGVPLPTKPTKEAWVNYGKENPPQYTAEQIEEIQKTMDKKGEWVFNVGEVLPNPDVSTIINTICAQLQLLSTVIKEGAGKRNSLNAEGQNDNQSLQECVSATLEQAEWFKEMVEDGVTQLVEDMDHTYGIESAVDSYFTNEFSLDDHVDIAAEVESKLEDIVERMVEDKLQEVVEDKLREASIRINF